MVRKKVLVAMSGGVDSSVAAMLLLEKGYDVSGVTLRLWPGMDETIVHDSEDVARALGIRHHVLDLSKEFRKTVIEYFNNEYIGGRTPNPCIACNRHIKYGALLEYAVSLGVEYLASGHYARICLDEESGRYLLKKARFPEKDQSYVLYRLTQQQLARILLPLGIYPKDEIRSMAEKNELPVASKKESQEICFIEGTDYAGFIRENAKIEMKPGNFLDTKGNIIGRHNGITGYTIGQRKGLGMTFGRPMYVVGIDAKSNNIVLGDESETYSGGLVATDVNLITTNGLEAEKRVMVKTRYSSREARALIYPYEGEEVKVVFDTPQRAVTPGQSAVFYEEDTVVGGGVIKSSVVPLKRTSV